MAGRIIKGATFKPLLDNQTVGEFLFNSASKYGDNICQIDADLDTFETFGSAKERSVKVAINLQNKGVTSKDVICFCCYNSLDNTIPMMATLFLGAKVASLDPTLSARHTKHLLGVVFPKIVFVDAASVGLIEKCLEEAEIKSEIIVLGLSDKYATFQDMLQPSLDEDSFRPANVDVHDIVLLFFSSGTTGLPKAICHSHYSLLQMTEIQYTCDYKHDRFLHATTMYWISGILIMMRTFLEGATRDFTRNFEGEEVFKMIEKYKLTSLMVAPIYTYELTRVPNPERYDTSSFRYLFTGGTAISTEQYKKLTRLFPNALICFGYGLSEGGMVSMFHPDADRSLFSTKIGSCGKVLPNMLLKIVNPDTDELLAPYQKGEVRTKSASLMKGYYNADSSSCFDKDGFLKTGDIGYYDEDNCLYVVERIKEMFKYKSWHIVPSTIEKVLLEHPAVKEAAVFGVPRGEDGEVPAACVVLEKGCSVDKKEIECFVAERVSEREMLRGGVIFVKYLPKTPTGKLIRKEVKNIAIKSM